MTRRKRRSSPALRCLQLLATLGATAGAGLAITEVARLLGVR